MNSTAQADMSGIMTEVANQLRAGLARTRSAVSHSGTKGESQEKAVTDFLREHFPSSIEFAKGQVLDSKGNISKQQDIIALDASRTPSLFRSNDIRLVPSEGVIACFEVKTRLQKKDVPSVIENMRSVKSLKKGEYYYPHGPIVSTTNIYGMELNHSPTLYFVFAFEGDDPHNLGLELQREQDAQGLKVYERVDCGLILDQGVLLNHCPNGSFDAVPQPGSVLKGYQTPHALLLFHMLASRYLLQANIPAVKIQSYLPDKFVF